MSPKTSYKSSKSPIDREAEALIDLILKDAFPNSMQELIGLSDHTIEH